MANRAVCVISEQGLQNMMAAGISTGWLRAWLLSAGATEVSITMFESNIWFDSKADRQLFFAGDDELNTVMQQHGFLTRQEDACFTLDNPQRLCWHYSHEGKQIVLLSLGDIAFQRDEWLSRINDGAPLLPMYVRADDTLPVALEPGLSADLTQPTDKKALNISGMLIEEQVIAILRQNKLSVRTVESCTAGAIATRLCRVPGASEVVDRSWVTYSNSAKQEEVGVTADVLEEHGAVSEAVVRAMAEGEADDSHICLAVSGIAGPGGGTAEKPIGTVWIALAMAGQRTVSQRLYFTGARYEIQARTVVAALNLLLIAVDNKLTVCPLSKYPPAEPEALICEPLEAAFTEPSAPCAPKRGYTSCN